MIVKRLKMEMIRFPKKIVALTLILAVLISYFDPIKRAIALSYGEGENSINLDIVNQLGFTINSVTVNGDDWESSQDEFHTTDEQYHIEISVSGNDVTGDTIPRIQYGGNWNDYMNLSTQHNGNTHIFVLDLNNTAHQGFLGLSIEEEDGYGVDEPHFDGHAYVVWSCGEGTCYHEFIDIPTFDDGRSTFYKYTDITADNNTSIHFDVDAQYKAWVLPDRFHYWTLIYKEQNHIEQINWANVDPEDIIAEFPPDMREWESAAIDAGMCVRPHEGDSGDLWSAFEWCVDDYYVQAGNLPFIRLQPVGEPQDNNAYVSYGDRNFKVVIYNDDFKGITMGDLEELSYYPEHFTNPFVRQDQFDISGTTKNRPAMLNSILLESTVIIRALQYNSFAISSIEALDVPAGAVSITKDSTGDFKLVFSSNFYDNVVFKVTDSKGEVSYLQVKRFTIDGWVANHGSSSTLMADFYFDREKYYSDFDLTAKVILNDGTIKNVILHAKNGIDDGLGNISDGYEVDEQSRGGKGLKKSTFKSELDGIEEKDIDKIYLNAEYKGSTETNYAGAYVGSGEGTLANLYKGEGE